MLLLLQHVAADERRSKHLHATFHNTRVGAGVLRLRVATTSNDYDYEFFESSLSHRILGLTASGLSLSAVESISALVPHKHKDLRQCLFRLHLRQETPAVSAGHLAPQATLITSTGPPRKGPRDARVRRTPQPPTRSSNTGRSVR